MTRRESSSTIEATVGVARHATEHYARAVSAEERVYILHSRECLASFPDLRKCPFSLALDLGITDMLPTWAWQHLEDRAVPVVVSAGYLLPKPSAVGQSIIDPPPGEVVSP